MAFFLSLAALSACSSVPAGQELYFGGFDGIWEGRLIGEAGADYPFAGATAGDLDLRLEVVNSKVRIFVFDDGEHWELKPESFTFASHKTNAVIYSITSSEDVYDKTGYGGWVETWSFNLTLGDEKVLFVRGVRLVNNYLMDIDEQVDDVVGRYLTSHRGTLRKMTKP